MTDPIYIEPAREHRQGFARWCLDQDPRIEVASATGSEVPADLFAGVPLELLDGAYIDGHIFRPVVEGKAPHGDGYRDEAAAEPGKQPVRRTRKKSPAGGAGVTE